MQPGGRPADRAGNQRQRRHLGGVNIHAQA
jgi:hypothetical protein